MGLTSCLAEILISAYYFEHEISPTITPLANEDLWRFSKVDMNTHKSTAIYLQTNHHDPKDKK